MQVSEPSYLNAEIVAFSPFNPNLLAISFHNLLHTQAQVIALSSQIYKVFALPLFNQSKLLSKQKSIKYPSQISSSHFTALRSLQDFYEKRASRTHLHNYALEWHQDSQFFMLRRKCQTVHCYSIKNGCILALKEVMNFGNAAAFSPFGPELVYFKKLKSERIAMVVFALQEQRVQIKSTKVLPEQVEYFDEVKWLDFQTVCIYDANFFLVINIYDLHSPLLIVQNCKIQKPVFSPDLTHLLYGITNRNNETLLKVYNLACEYDEPRQDAEYVDITNFIDQKIKITQNRDYSSGTKFLVQMNTQSWILQDFRKYIMEIEGARENKKTTALRTLKWCQSLNQFIAVSYCFAQEIRVYTHLPQISFGRRYLLSHVLSFQSPLIGTQFIHDSEIMLVNYKDGWVLYNFATRIAFPVDQGSEQFKLTELAEGLMMFQELKDDMGTKRKAMNKQRVRVLGNIVRYGKLSENVVNLMKRDQDL